MLRARFTAYFADLILSVLTLRKLNLAHAQAVTKGLNTCFTLIFQAM